MVYTEFVSSDALIRNVSKTQAKLSIRNEERPVAIQIYGRETAAMADAARICEEACPDVLDINFGCPVKKVAGKGAGAGMLRDIPKMLEITRAVVNAVKIPVTVKTRLGWDHDSRIIVELAEQLQDCGIQALTIHGRTRSQMYTGEADWTLIGEVKNNPRMHIPIIGNGDITSAQKLKEYYDRYGVDGVMIGRATYGRPWIFREVKHFLRTGEVLPQPSVAERVEIAREGLEKPRGRYVTLEVPSVSVLDERDAAVIEVCARELRALLPPEGPVLVLGVGNRRITADALGPRTVQRILVTMGAGAAPPVRGLRPVAAVAPGVAAATGLSLQQLAAALVGQLRPAAVVCVDSLCSAEGQRLGRTVQFSDAGLYPAQADHTRHLTRDTLGVPVVAAGIPTLMQAQEGADLVVTPRALDSVIAHGAALLAGSVNRALQPRLTVQQLCWLTG